MSVTLVHDKYLGRVTVLVLLLCLNLAAPQAAEHVAGYQPTVYAIQHARVVVEARQAIDSATVVMRDGVIEAVGLDKDVTIPFDAETIDGTGLVVYPGFIDAYSAVGVNADVDKSKTGAGRKWDYSTFAFAATPPDNRHGLTPEFRVSEALTLNDAAAKPRRELGFTAVLAAPGGGVASGQSALVSLNGKPRREIMLHSPVGLHVELGAPGGRIFPTTLMGCVAHLRQALLDARHHEQAWAFYRDHGGPRPASDPTLETLRAVQRRRMPVFWRADTRDGIHRALDLAREFRVRPVIVGGREAWRVADRLKREHVPVVLSIDFPQPPKFAAAPKKPSSVPKDVVDFVRNSGELPPAVQEKVVQQIERLFSAKPTGPSKADTAKKAELTKKETPAQTTKLPAKKLRTLPESRRVLAERMRRWAQQVACAAVLADKRVSFCFSTDGHEKLSDFPGNLHKAIELGLSPDAALTALTRDAAKILGVTSHLGKLTPGAAAHVVVYSGPFHEAKSKLRYVFIDRDKFELNKPPAAPAKKQSADKPAAKPDSKAAKTGTDKTAPTAKTKQTKDDPPAEPFSTEIAADRIPSFRTGGNVVIRHATVLTVTRGTLSKATIVVCRGKIAAVGQQVRVPKDFPVIEAAGLFVMPGIIDSHSHIAISGGVNDGSLSVVPEVRITDVVNSESRSIYQALAGGVTAARLLHGSANSIGGQDAVIKLRHGRPARELIVHDRPRGVKFALGENPKRSETRYPDTRLGVESTIRRAFAEGRAYREQWRHYGAARARGESVLEPRRDLRLEALADVLDRRLLIHCHCYRADEILMLLRLAETHRIRVQSLQHVLEGYKVAAEIAAHGASGSTFSDWWAYKFEAYDAIPQNAVLMRAAGVNTVIKSDSSELIRHLNHEAAKSLKYDDLTPEQTLAMITINPAREIGLERRIGSIEVGKDADLAIFNRHPLDMFARCEMTLVDGEVYFEGRGAHKPGQRAAFVPPQRLRSRQLKIPPAPQGVVALRNARIVPVAGPPIKRGTVIISKGRIQSVDSGNVPTPPEATVINLAGLSVYPGMINAGGSLGLTEIGAATETHDYRERATYNEDLRAVLAVHPDSALIPVARAAGVLTALTQLTGGTISGQSVLMNLHGWIPQEMSFVDPCALHINFPRGTFQGGTAGAADKDTKENPARKQIDELKERFRLALQYHKLTRTARRLRKPAPIADPRLAALIPYAQGKRPVIIHANRHGDILEAIDFAGELKLKWILTDARDAWKCIDALKKNSVPVILGPSLQLPSGEYTPYDEPYRTAAKLHQAGIKFAIKATVSGAASASSTQNLPYQAGMAVAYGLPEDEGLKAVTLYPAQILGVAKQLGSIERGKLANLVITDGHLLQPATRIKALFIQGVPLAPTSKHTRLYDRYRGRLEQVRQGKAMLGVRSSKSFPRKSADRP